MTCLRLVSLKDRNLCFEFTGFSRFAFQISNHIMFMPVYAYQRAQAGVRMYIIMSTCINYLSICNQMLKSFYFRNFFLEILGGMENSEYFCTRF